MKITISYHNVLRKKDASLAQMMVVIYLWWAALKFTDVFYTDLILNMI